MICRGLEAETCAQGRHTPKEMFINWINIQWLIFVLPVGGTGVCVCVCQRIRESVNQKIRDSVNQRLSESMNQRISDS